MPILAIIVKILSNLLPLLTADAIPSGIPTLQVINITINVNSNVLGILSLSFVETFSPAEV